MPNQHAGNSYRSCYRCRVVLPKNAACPCGSVASCRGELRPMSLQALEPPMIETEETPEAPVHARARRHQRGSGPIA